MTKGPLLLGLAVLLPLSVYTVEAAASDVYAGAYAGLYGGHSKANDEGTAYSKFYGNRNGWGQDASPKGGIYGLKAGYNWLLGGNLLLGLEADYERRTKSQDETFQEYFGVTSTLYSAKTELKQGGSLRARFGYLFNGKGLVYLTGGYAAVEAKRTWNEFGRTSESHTDWQDGWSAGAGIEYLLLDNVSAAVEYRYTDYENEDVDANLWRERYEQKLAEKSLRVSVNYLF